MSGLEVAGIVLGAFPLAILALERYREVATRLGLFYKIKLQHKKCMDDLSCQQLYLTRHLRQLILPLAVNYDDAKINELLSNPGGPGWRDDAVSTMLTERLQDSYGLYLSYIQGMQQTMEELNRELSTDTDSVQEQMQHPSVSKIRLKTKESRQFQAYRVKFCNGESVRKRLFAELQDYNTKLEKLLDSSDKDAQLVKQVAGTKLKAVDAAICTFWVQAAKVFQTLAAAWTCHCRQQHYAKLQLQHRTTKKPEFTILFETSGLAPLPWDKRRARISEGSARITAQVETAITRSQLPIRGPSPTPVVASKSALKVNKSCKTGSVGFLMPPPSITVTHIETATRMDGDRQITSLCSSLRGLNKDCCGYLSDDDCRYYVYAELDEDHGWQTHVTLDDMLRGQAMPRPTRRQRYAVSLIVASSFVQLLETPWLPGSLSKSDILFFKDSQQTRAFKLDQPHVTRQFINTAEEGGAVSPSAAGTLSRSLDQLGILLLELCFGSVLEDQLCRKQWPAGKTEMERSAFDIIAARDWLEQVVDEAGIEYSEAVAWCLGGNRTTQGGPGQWREEMLRRVVQPLQRCRDYLTADVPRGL